MVFRVFLPVDIIMVKVTHEDQAHRTESAPICL